MPLPLPKALICDARRHCYIGPTRHETAPPRPRTFTEFPMQPTEGPLSPAVPPKAPPTPHSGEGSDSALEALKRVLRERPAARDRRGLAGSAHPA
ncbi:hypothetical protein GCM10028796_53870 [Ramlibacter monticola]